MNPGLQRDATLSLAALSFSALGWLPVSWERTERSVYTPAPVCTCPHGCASTLTGVQCSHGCACALMGAQCFQRCARALTVLHVPTLCARTPLPLRPRELTSWNPLSEASEMTHHLSNCLLSKTVGGTCPLHLVTVFVYKISLIFSS